MVTLLKCHNASVWWISFYGSIWSSCSPTVYISMAGNMVLACQTWGIDDSCIWPFTQWMATLVMCQMLCINFPWVEVLTMLQVLICEFGRLMWKLSFVLSSIANTNYILVLVVFFSLVVLAIETSLRNGGVASLL